MRIAIIGSRGIPAHYGGFETFAQELAPRLVRAGHEVTVYCREGYTGDPPPKEYRGVRLIHTPYLRRRSLETLSHEFTSILDSLRRGVDLYYFLGTRSSPLYAPLRLTRRAVVVHTDGIEWKRRKWGSAGRAYLKASEWIAARVGSDALVTDAEAMRDYYLTRYRRDSTHISYGAPVVASDRHLAGDYFLLVCRLEPENNVDLAIREFLASESDRELVIVGGWNYGTAHSVATRQLAEAGRGRVRFAGPVYGEELQALRAGCYSYIHGHEVGGTNPSLLESMGCGACCLVLDTPFNREALGGTGLLWTKQEGSLATLIARVEAEGETVSSLGNAARERVSATFDWDSVASAHERVFADTRKN